MTNPLYEQFVQALGGFPERTSPQSICLERIDCGEYVREKHRLVMQDRVIPLYLLLPHGPKPRPAILAHHQHAGQYPLGKSEPAGITGNPQMAYARQLAEAGYVVAAWDAVGFEERYNALFGARHEHFLAMETIANGGCLEQAYLLDSMIVADFLYQRPEVATDKGLGCIGHSLGGQNVLFNLMVDDRVTIGVSSCGIATVQSFIEEQVTHNFAWYVPGILKLGDTPGLAPLLQGKHLFVSQGTRDGIFPMRGVQAFVDAAAKHAKLDTFFFDGEHEFPDTARTRAVKFFDAYYDRGGTGR